ncbi:MAG: hypothetical protein AB1760_00290 [Pseudomonadota bacterium]
MAFSLIEDISGAPAVKRSFLMTNSEACTAGEALMFSSGRLTKLTGGNKPAVIAAETKAAGTDVSVECYLISPTQIWEVGYTGVPDAGFVVGCNSADIDGTGLLINAADVVGGAFSIVSKDTTNSKVTGFFVGRQLN